MHLSTEEPAAFRMLELFGEVGIHFIRISFSINDKINDKKLSRGNSSKNITAGVLFLFLVFRS